MARRCRSCSTCSQRKAYALAGRAASMWPAPSALRATWAPVIRSSRCWPITAPATKAGCSTRHSCVRRVCRFPLGSTPANQQRRPCSSRLGSEMIERSKSWLTETDELAAELDAPDIVIIDASWHMPGDGKSAREEYLEEHIPGAIFFDIDEIADTKSNLPHMLPSPEKSSSRMRSMGIGDGSRIVVYDSAGIYSAPRVWWTFRVMGVEDVTVLNGGLPKWKREGLPLESGEPRLRSTRHFTSRRNADLVRDVSDMKALIKDRSAVVVEARWAERFPDAHRSRVPGFVPAACPAPTTFLTDG